jgi:hypothetical protein
MRTAMASPVCIHFMQIVQRTLNKHSSCVHILTRFMTAYGSDQEEIMLIFNYDFFLFLFRFHTSVNIRSASTYFVWFQATVQCTVRCIGSNVTLASCFT